MKILKKITVKLNFLWDTEIVTTEVSITVPNTETPETVMKAINEAHSYLCFEDDTDIYGVNGRTAQSLLDYVCEEHNWTWEEINFEIEMNFN